MHHPIGYPEKARFIAVVFACLALVSCGAFEPPTTSAQIPIEYPIVHYRITSNGLDFVEWKKEVRALRGELRRTYPFEDRQPTLEGTSREVEFLDKAVDPALIIWRDPAAFWRDPATLSWWELIDENGEIIKVLVVATNQTRNRDAKIIRWCLENKTWEPAVIEGKSVPSLRSASINLGESRWHIGYWQKKFSGELVSVFATILIALVAYGVVLGVRRKRSDRPESL